MCSNYEKRALVGEKYCGHAGVNENKKGSVLAVLGLERLSCDDIDKWFDEQRVEETS